MTFRGTQEISVNYVDSISFLPFFGLVLTGAVVGLAVGLTGVGGGSLMTPALISGFGINPIIAVGTDLAFAALTKTVGIVAHRATQLVRWKIALLLVVSSVPGCLAALWFLQGQTSDVASVLIKKTLGIALLMTVLALLFKNRLPVIPWHKTRYLLGLRTALTALAGFIIGWAVGWTSIGAGAIGCTLLALLYSELSPQEVAATDIAYAVPLTAVGALGHAWLGHIDYTLLAALLIGSTPAIWFGIKLSQRLTQTKARSILAVFLSLAAFKSLGAI